MSTNPRLYAVEQCLEIGRYIERQKRWVSSKEVMRVQGISKRQALRYMDTVERAFRFECEHFRVDDESKFSGPIKHLRPMR